MLLGTVDLERDESWINVEARQARRLELAAVAEGVHAVILELVRQKRQGMYELCVQLGRMHDDALWKHVAGGCSTFTRYAVKFGAASSPTEARQLVTLAHQLPSLKILGPLFQRGEVDWTKIREAAPAVLRKPEDEARWAEKVRVSSFNVVRADAQIALGKPPTKDVTLSVPLDQDAQAEHFRQVAGERLGVKLTRAQFQLLVLDAALDAGFLEDLRPASEEVADAAAARDTGRADSPDELPDADADAAAADPSAKVSTADPDPAAPKRKRDRAARVSLPTTCFLVHRCPRCHEAEVDGPDGPVPIRPERAAQLAVDAWLLAEDGTLSRTIPARIRRRVFARDRGRCQAPGCGSRHGLHFHHTGGWKQTGHDEDQLTILCRACHIHLHHGWISIQGRHSTGFRYLDAGGTELMAPVSTWRPQSPSPGVGPVTPATPSPTRVCAEASPTADLEAALREVRFVLPRMGVPVEWAEEILAHVLTVLPPNATTGEIVGEVYRHGMS
jgi:hypothetical protein